MSEFVAVVLLTFMLGAPGAYGTPGVKDQVVWCRDQKCVAEHLAEARRSSTVARIRVFTPQDYRPIAGSTPGVTPFPARIDEWLQ